MPINDGGYTRLKVLDARTYRELPAPGLPENDHVKYGSYSHDGRYAAFSVVTPQSPSQFWIHDWRTNTSAHWEVGSTATEDSHRFAAAHLESYPARDGTSIPMFVRRPLRCEEPCPVIVHFHGGPMAQSVAGFDSWALPQLFVDAGFVFVEPNIRGSSGYGKAWVHADDRSKRADVISDVEDCARFIRSSWSHGRTPPKIGALGWSYGGYCALMGMTFYAGAYDAGVSIVGVSDWVTFMKNIAPHRRMIRIDEYGDPDSDRDLLTGLSPITYADRLRGPLLQIQGASDPRMLVGDAVHFHSILQARRIPSKLILFADEGHAFQKRETRILELGHTLEFFQTHLQGRKMR